jgi:23S rRNA (adenine2503-C2)-methyltransferase
LNPTATASPAKTELLGLSLEKLGTILESLGEKGYRARQLAEWIYKKKVGDFGLMHNLSKALREKLAASCQVGRLEVASRMESKRDGTTKYLFRCADGELVESVWLPHEGRHTACLSTQVGCAMGCRFCATGESGFSRHLSPAEIVGQVLAIEEDQGRALDNLVYMGMGEPMANWEAVAESTSILTSPAGRNWSGRKITLSTCGVVPGIAKLAESGLGARLAVSLHAAEDGQRDGLMPINRKYPLEKLMEACRSFQKSTGQQITFEVTLFDGVNDRDEDARRMASLVQGLECKVNLIPYNPVEGLPYRAPAFSRVLAFQAILKQQGVMAILRTEKGGDIDAACGQLRRRNTAQGEGG